MFLRLRLNRTFVHEEYISVGNSCYFNKFFSKNRINHHMSTSPYDVTFMIESVLIKRENFD